MEAAIRIGSILAYGFIGGIGFYVGQRLTKEAVTYDDGQSVDVGILAGLFWPVMIPGLLGWAWAAGRFDREKVDA